MPMTTRDALYQLIDELDDDELAQAELYLRALREDDRVLQMLLTAPWDDEPLTDEERAALAEARAEVARGELIDDQDIQL
jgi:hypothetical protein